MTEAIIGKKAPDFSLPTDGNGTISLASLKGKNVVLYFYPKDDTPGCTTEAKEFRDSMEQFEAQDTVIIGVSKDTPSCHNDFKKKYNLNFTLVSDKDGSLCEAYDVWKEKSMYGKKYMGIERSTFLIDKQGILRKEWRKVSVNGHADEVFKVARAL